MKEVGSGAAERELPRQLINAARRREIDVVLVWRLDRCRSVGRSGFHAAGLLAVFAQFERKILGERVKAGLAHVRLSISD